MSTQDHQNWNHNFITFLAQVMHFTRLKQVKSIYLAPFNSPRKTSQTVSFIFLSNTTLHAGSKKIGSLHFDTPSSRYEFLKLVFKSVKNKKIKTNTVTDGWGPLVSRTQASATPG